LPYGGMKPPGGGENEFCTPPKFIGSYWFYEYIGTPPNGSKPLEPLLNCYYCCWDWWV